VTELVVWFLAIAALALWQVRIAIRRWRDLRAAADEVAAEYLSDVIATTDLGAVWADSEEAKAVLKQGRETKPTRRWRCCRCGAGFLLSIDPDSVPVPWWYWEEGATWNNPEKDPVAWACPACGTYSYTVPLP
jgi:rubrerythrin